MFSWRGEGGRREDQNVLVFCLSSISWNPCFSCPCMERQAFSPSIGAICSDRTFWNVSTYHKITQVGEALGVNPAPSSIEQLADFLSKHVEEGRTASGKSAACRLLPLFWCGLLLFWIWFGWFQLILAHSFLALLRRTRASFCFLRCGRAWGISPSWLAHV